MVSPMTDANDDLGRAVDLLAAGDWQHAHEIVQAHDSALAAWLHGVVHTLEGDLNNARYWYRKTDRSFRGPEAVQEEIAEARRAMADAMSTATRRPRPSSGSCSP
jgi:hypothetical protein